MNDERERVTAAMRRINDAWLESRVEDLGPLVHDNMVMVLPGFAGRIEGREPFLAGFRDFCENATVRQFRVGAHHVDVVSDTAVVSFDYEMLYERSAEQYRVTGRELWVFAKQAGSWLAVWRTMLDLDETAA